MKTISDHQIAFQTMNRNPDTSIDENCLAQYAVNALAIALDLPWEEAVSRLIKQSHRLCLMPTDSKCVRAMMEQSGFVLQPGTSKACSVAQMCSNMANLCHNGEVAVVMSRSCTYGSYATALLPSAEGLYSCFGTRDTRRRQIEDVWVRWPDGKDHSPVARKKGRTESKTTQKRELANHAYFHYALQNPGGNYIGDCVVRGIASAMDITWHEAVDELIRSGNYRYVAINYNHFYDKLLKEKGFIRHKQMKRSGRALTAKEFCDEMNKTYCRGERIFAHVGRCHVAAIIPITIGDTTTYQVEDSWDSSNRTVGEYWVGGHIQPEKTIVPRQPQYSAGQWIQHPSFGKGCVIHVSDPATAVILEVDFSDQGMKQLSAKWVSEHCKQIPAQEVRL